MTKDNPNAPEPNDNAREKDAPVPGPEIENFFQRLPGNFRRPKPSPEAVAAAVEAVNRLSGGAPVPTSSATTAADSDETAKACPACGGSLPAAARFCVWCGVSAQSGAGDAASGQHHFHHHYHHYVSGPAESGTAPGRPNADSETSGPRGRVAAPSATGSTAGAPSSGIVSGTASGPSSGMSASASGGRAEMSARKVVLDWAHACNIKHIDDLLELYAADATLMRPSLPPVRSLPAIREFLVSMLEAGLGDVEMESLRFEIMGDVAIDLGRCRMLVPVAMGKRREERGKYLVVLVRQPVGTWKILADSWSSDQIVGATPESTPRKGNEPVQPPRKGR